MYAKFAIYRTVLAFASSDLANIARLRCMHAVLGILTCVLGS